MLGSHKYEKCTVALPSALSTTSPHIGTVPVHHSAPLSTPKPPVVVILVGAETTIDTSSHSDPATMSPPVPGAVPETLAVAASSARTGAADATHSKKTCLHATTGRPAAGTTSILLDTPL